MLQIVIVEKNGNVKGMTLKSFNENDLFKKCGFKINEGFILQHKWKVNLLNERYKIHVYGKTDGRSSSINKYEFPPLMDNTLLYGKVAIVSTIKCGEHYMHDNLTVEKWNAIYNTLFGGFEDLNKTVLQDEEEIDELKDIPDSQKTKEGYKKDGFVVNDDEIIEYMEETQSVDGDYDSTDLSEDDYNYETE